MATSKRDRQVGFMLTQKEAADLQRVAGSKGMSKYVAGLVSKDLARGDQVADRDSFSYSHDDADDTGEDTEGREFFDESPGEFHLERDLQQALRDNIHQLDPGLTIVDDDSEQRVPAGRIDILAEDADGNLVVIELKAGTAGRDSIGQLLSYMGSVDNPQGNQIRGMLVAYDFDERLIMAARAVPHVSLKKYSFHFAFEDC